MNFEKYNEALKKSLKLTVSNTKLKKIRKRWNV